MSGTYQRSYSEKIPAGRRSNRDELELKLNEQVTI